MARLTYIKLVLISGLISVLLWGCGSPNSAPSEIQVEDSTVHADGDDHTHDEASVEMPHLHGIGYSADGTQLFVAAHIGLQMFTDNAWHNPDLPAHDYMGYASTASGFYSSGHPDPKSNLPNPLGLVKSTDGGQTLTTLAFSGESDFHTMAAGYQSHAIYVLNLMPNSQIGTGLFYSLDDGATWQQSAAQGAGGQPIQLAVHPSDPATLALVTDAGLFLSVDHGASFELLRAAKDSFITAASFDHAGTTLFYGGSTLASYKLDSKEFSEIETPQLTQQDAISYIAINPVNPQEMTIATFARNMYRTQDIAQTWQQIAAEGVGID